ncbi:MAG: serine/threonine-protein kinase [Myxococcaceae bacterium]
MEAFEPGTRIADKYQLVRPIGRGGMGEVWEAVNEGVGKRVAIKLLEPKLAQEPEFMRRFELEAQAAALIDHPDIVDVLDTGTTAEGAPYMVMEFLQGITLRQLHKANKKLSVNQALAVICPVLDALAAAHAAGIVHRDLKPANIFLAIKPRPSVKILDFGISKFQQSDGMTKTGVTLGTPAYMAPEQVRDSRKATGAADLYSVGGMLYALLSGRAPFEGDSDMAIVAQVLTEVPPPLKDLHPGLPAEVYKLIDRCLAKDVKYRPASATELREALLALGKPDEEWLYAKVRDMTPALEQSRPGLRVTGERPISDSSRASRSGVSSQSSASAAARATAAERPSMRGAVPKPMATRTGVDADEVAPDAPTITPLRATGSKPQVAPAPKSQAPLFAAVGVVIVLAIGVLIFALTRPAQPVVPVADPTPEPPKPPAQVQLTLKAEPPEAKWKVGDSAECNPCTITGKQGAHATARVSAEGFSATELQLEFDQTRVVAVTLQPVVAVTTTTTPTDDPNQVKTPPADDPPKQPAGKKTPTGKKKKGLELDETNPFLKN